MSADVPAHWVTVPLSAIAEVRLGRQRSPSNVEGQNQRPYLRAANVTWGGLALDDVKHMNFEPHEAQTYELRAGDLLLSEASGSASEVGKPALWRNEIPGACFQNTLIRVRPFAAESAYLYWHFLWDARAGHFAAAGKGVGINHLGADKMNAWPTRLPPTGEQRRIVARLDELTARSRRAKESLAAVPPLLDKLRQSILAAAFRGDLTADWRTKNPNAGPAPEPQPWHPRGGRLEAAQATAEHDAVTSGALPATWRTCRLGQIVDMSFGFAFASSQFTHTGTRLLRGINIGLGQTRWDDTVFADGAAINPEHKLMEGDIVIAMDRPFIADGFRVARLTKEDCPAYLVQRVARLRTAAGVDQRYAFLFLQSEGYQRHLRARVTGSSVPHVSGIDIGSAWMALPPLAEQQEIARRLSVTLSPLTTLASLTAAQLKKLEDIDTSLLASAFRGELVTQDPNDEPAAVLLDQLRDAPGDANATPTPRSTRPSARAAEGGNAAPTRRSSRTSPHAAGRGIVAPSAPAPASTEPPSGFDADSLIEHSATALWLRGPLDKDAAVRRVTDHLRDAGLVSFQRLRGDGPLYAQLAGAIDAAVKAGHLDRPRRGQVRACKPDATAYTADDWRHALLAVLGPSPTDRDDAIRAAAEWARDNCGLEFTRLRADGHIVTGLRSALNSAIRTKLITRIDATRIARAPDSPADRQTTLFES